MWTLSRAPMVGVYRQGWTAVAMLIAMTFVVAGCTFLPTLREQPEQYALSAPRSSVAPGPQAGWQLLVDGLTAPAGLDTPSIAVRQRPAGLDYYEGVAWTDRTPVMVQRLLVEAFENSGRITGVGREGLGIRANYILRCELRDFHANTIAATMPEIVVRTSCTLIRMPEREVIARQTHSGTATAAGTRFPLIIAAFDRAVDDILTDIVEWALSSGNADFSAREGRS